MLQLYSWLALLLSLVLTWPGRAGCTLQLQPTTRLAGWQAHGTWVLNGPRTIAAGSAAKGNEIHILRRQEGTWLLAGVITPPDPAVADFVPGSVLLSNNGRLLAVAASSKPQLGTDHPGQPTVGYLYKVVAQRHSQHAFKYQLAERLVAPPDTSHDSGRHALPHTRAQISMADDGSTVLACWHQQQEGHTAAGSSPAADDAGATAAASPGAAATAAGGGNGGGAAVFIGTGQRQQARPVMLSLPKGRFGESCKLSADGRVVLVMDGAQGALVFRLEAAAAKGSAVAYKAAGWLAGAPARNAYRVLAADLGPAGEQAVLLVQGAQQQKGTAAAAAAEAVGGRSSTSTIKLFGAGAFGRWSHLCDINLGEAAAEEQETGEVKLAAFPGGLHIWVALGSQQLMFDVVLDGAQLGQPCPTRPVLVTLPPTAAVSAVGMVQPARGQAGQHGSRRGQLRVVGDEAVFIAA